MDLSVRPQDDFYNYVNGTWMKTTQIPSDKVSWGSFHELIEKTEESELKILNELLSKNFEKGSEGEKIQRIYRLYMDVDKRNRDGIEPIRSNLKKIDDIQNVKQLQAYFINETKSDNNQLYGWDVDADLKNSKINSIYLGGPSLGLGRDYYQKKNKENTNTLNHYEKYLASLLKVIDGKNVDKRAKDIVNFEKQLAGVLLTNEEERDSNNLYNPRTLKQLSAISKNIDFVNYFKNTGINPKEVILTEVKYYQNLDKFINQKNISLIKDYLKARVLSNAATFLSQDIDNLHFDFYNRFLQGQKEQRPMEKRALSLIDNILGEAFGKLYVEKNFPKEAKDKMINLIDYLIKAYRTRINNVDWMTQKTKEKALEKLEKLTIKVAYPDQWKDYSKLNLDSETLYGNLVKVDQWAFQKNLDEKIGKPVDKTEWGMTPQTVNAYYNPSNNEIVFPAAILQAPFFDFRADPAVNFGGIGAVIGHEISHGFDDSGANFDAEGNLVNWWTVQDRKNFDKKVKELADQYSKYEPVKGVFVNGTFTSGENIADLGGASIAFDALQLYLKDHGQVEDINHFTQNQRFFLSWGTIWRTKSREQYLINQVKTDTHSPGYFRSFGPLVNIDAFYDAFNIKPGDKIYKVPENRIKIW